MPEILRLVVVRLSTEHATTLTMPEILRPLVVRLSTEHATTIHATTCTCSTRGTRPAPAASGPSIQQLVLVAYYRGGPKPPKSSNLKIFYTQEGKVSVYLQKLSDLQKIHL